MGHGSYKASDWTKLKLSKGIDSSSNANELFKNTSFKDIYNPLYINMRESCDSEDSPESTPIIIGFDVTGSMGYLAKEIATNALNKTILDIYDKKPVTNPHIMCAAIGDVVDHAPLQVTQFEADIRVVEQLLVLWLEGRGDDAPEDYNLLWYFADKHTTIDAFEKRNKKGFLFTIGDATVHSSISKTDIKKIFGDDVNKDLKNSVIIDSVSKKYELIHINISSSISIISMKWQKELPGRIIDIDKNDVEYLSDVIIAALQLAGGMSRKDVLSQLAGKEKTVVSKAISKLTVFDKKLFFRKK